MTTPAENVVQTIMGDSTPYSKTCSGGYVAGTTSSRLSKSFKRQRPASQSMPKGPSGWRNPTNWQLTQTRSNPGPIGEVEVTQIDGCSAGQRHGNLCQGVCFTIPDSTLLAPPSWMSQSANTRAYTRLKGQQTNYSVAFAERKETEELATSVIERITKSVNAFKSHSWKDFLKAAKVEGTSKWRETPQKWLELQYGWNPLMADVQGACTDLDTRNSDKDAYYCHVKGNVKQDDSVYEGKVNSLVVGQGAYCDLWSYHHYEVTTQLWYTQDNSLLATFSSLGLTNPLDLIWERTPYSFVVDWFLPVGNWLSSFDADFGWSFKSGIQTRFSRLVRRGSMQTLPDIPHFDVHYRNSCEPYKQDSVFMARSVLGAPPGVGLPHFKNPFSSTHLANALSLLTNAFRIKH
jgi:hypothetical protein